MTDGGSGFASAVKKEWPSTRVQRCAFHAFCKVKRYTTTRPKLQAGQEPYRLSKDLLHIGTLHQAGMWVERLMQWCDFWNDFLNEKTRVCVYYSERRQNRRYDFDKISANMPTLIHEA